MLMMLMKPFLFLEGSSFLSKLSLAEFLVLKYLILHLLLFLFLNNLFLFLFLLLHTICKRLGLGINNHSNKSYANRQTTKNRL